MSLRGQLVYLPLVWVLRLMLFPFIYAKKVIQIYLKIYTHNMLIISNTSKIAISSLLADHILISILGYALNIGKAIGTLIFALFANIIGITMNALQFIGSKNHTRLLVFMFNWYRAWSYPLGTLYIKSKFESHYFGRLVGILRFTMGISSITVIGLAETLPNGFAAIFIAFMVTLVISFVFPVTRLMLIKQNKVK